MPRKWDQAFGRMRVGAVKAKPSASWWPLKGSTPSSKPSSARFLRAGVKHYTSRKQWAAVALDAWRTKGSTDIALPKPTPEHYVRPQPKNLSGAKQPHHRRSAIMAALAAALSFVRC